MIVCRTCRTSYTPRPIFGYLILGGFLREKKILYRLGKVLQVLQKIMIDCLLILIYLIFGLLEVLPDSLFDSWRSHLKGSINRSYGDPIQDT